MCKPTYSPHQPAKKNYKMFVWFQKAPQNVCSLRGVLLGQAVSELAEKVTFDREGKEVPWGPFIKYIMLEREGSKKA